MRKEMNFGHLSKFNSIEIFSFPTIDNYILWKIRAATYFLSTYNSSTQNHHSSTISPPKKNHPHLKYINKISPDCLRPNSAS